MVRYQEFRPLSGLKDYVKNFYFLEHDGEPKNATYQRVTPDGCFELNFHYYENSLLKVSTDFEREQLSAVYLVSRASEHYFLRRTNFVRVVGVRFYPWGLHPFVRGNVSELMDKSLDAGVLWPGRITSVRNRLFDCKNHREATACLETVLTRQLLRAKKEDRMASAMARHIYDQRGLIRDNELFNASVLSARRLQQRFKAAIGMSVTSYRRVIRFQDILSRMHGTADLPLPSGYYDRSHFVRDFKAFAGITPRIYRMEQHPLDDLTSGKF